MSDERGIKFLDIKKEKIKIINTPNLKKNVFLLPFNIF